MWELCNKSFKVKGEFNKQCFVCGSFFRKNEDYYIIIIPSNLRGTHKKLNSNFVVHTKDWEDFCKDVKTEEELANKIISHKTPKKISFTQEEENNLFAFKDACKFFGFNSEVKKSYGIKMRKSGTSFSLEYNPYTDNIALYHRAKRGLFDSLFEKQICVDIYNKMHEILGDGKHNNFSAEDSFNKICADVAERMKDIL